MHSSKGFYSWFIPSFWLSLVSPSASLNSKCICISSFTHWMCWISAAIWLGSSQGRKLCRSYSLAGWRCNVDYIYRLGPKEILWDFLLDPPSLHCVRIVHGLPRWRGALQYRILWIIFICFWSLSTLLSITKQCWSSFNEVAALRHFWADISEVPRYFGTSSIFFILFPLVW